MIKAQVITIGTEIAAGEVVNTNAAWVSVQLENLGLRVFSHFTVRDQREEILAALKSSADHAVVVVTGGLGPTTDDMTRECMAQFTGQSLEFDKSVWQDLTELYRERGLPLRKAHEHQCYFPRGSRRLRNPVGTALGFAQTIEGQSYFVLPGPPPELEGMWNLEVAPALATILPSNTFYWQRWNCLGSPESEVAELVEKAIEGSGLEVGYRASLPYVKVKLYIDGAQPAHLRIVEEITRSLRPFLTSDDLAADLLRRWPHPILSIVDTVTENCLLLRLSAARQKLLAEKTKVPELDIHVCTETLEVQCPSPGLLISIRGDGFLTTLRLGEQTSVDDKVLPYKTSVSSERGKRSAAEWVLWSCARMLDASSRQL